MAGVPDMIVGLIMMTQTQISGSLEAIRGIASPVRPYLTSYPAAPALSPAPCTYYLWCLLCLF